MGEKLSVLFVGESCFATVTEYKGMDHFSETNYHESAGIMRRVFEGLGHDFTHIPCHLVSKLYPRDLESLQKFDVVLFSDVGSNTFLLLPEVVRSGMRATNLLSLTKRYVAEGGGFGMIGGYMTYQGMDAKGKWKDSHIEEVLPVSLICNDDRMEVPEGADLVCTDHEHPIMRDLPREWPYVLGYNRVIAKADAKVLVRFGADPIVAVGSYGKGRSLAYTTDCTPHWAPAAMHGWECYPKLWDNLVLWLAGRL